jgi:hypothetical protein
MESFKFSSARDQMPAMADWSSDRLPCEIAIGNEWATLLGGCLAVIQFLQFLQSSSRFLHMQAACHLAGVLL